MEISLQEENRRLREMCKKYLSWHGVVKDVEKALEEDLQNPEMWQDIAQQRLSAESNDSTLPKGNVR